MIIRSGQKIVHVLKNGEGILYEVVEDLVNPLRMIKTLSSEQVKNYQ